ncbi:MAG: HAD family hydrolase [Phycisphaerae bacterium]|nr:HAD family hydrolase [Phycisphaerae bacterium]
MSNKAVFIDRDDTLIADPGYINDPEQVRLITGAAEALVSLRKMGFKLFVISNQSAVARGIVTEKVLEQIHERLRQLLANNGAYLDKIYFCPFHPDGVIEKYRRESTDRKPNPGMLLKAAKEFNIDLSQSWMIGDRGRDIEAGRSAGCRTILIEQLPRESKPKAEGVVPDYKAVNLKEAVNVIKSRVYPPKPAANAVQNPAPQEIKSPPVQQVEENPVEVETEYETQPLPQNEPQPSQITIEQTAKSENLLEEVLQLLKKHYRSDLFDQFSLTRFFAGIFQAAVFVCLLVSFWFLLSPQEQSYKIFMTLAYAIVLQLMALSFYMMQRR